MQATIGKKTLKIDVLPIVFVWCVAIWAVCYWRSVLALPEGADSAFFIGPLTQVLLVFAVMITISCVHFCSAMPGEMSQEKQVKQTGISKSLRNRLLFILSIIIYAVVLPYTGAIMTSVGYALGLSMALKTRSPWKLLGIAIFISIFIVGIFVKILMVPLPLWGTLFE